MAIADIFTVPLGHVALTCAIYVGPVEINRRSRGHPLANPVLLSVCGLIGVLWLAKIDYQQYFANVQFIHFLLGPATVALAVPLARHHRRVRQAVLPIMAGVICGSAAGIASGLTICLIAGVDTSLAASLSTKSITAPVAMGIAEQMCARPSPAALPWARPVTARAPPASCRRVKRLAPSLAWRWA